MNIRLEVNRLRESRDGASADCVLLVDDISIKTTEIKAKNEQIDKLNAELRVERKAAKQLEEVIADLLVWVEKYRPQEQKPSLQTVEWTRHVEDFGSRAYVMDAPTFAIAFRQKPINAVVVWQVQVVKSYDSGKAPIFYTGKELPGTLKVNIKFLQFWCCDRLPSPTTSPVCLWCFERGLETKWTKGSEAMRPCVKCLQRGRHCFSVT